MIILQYLTSYFIHHHTSFHNQKSQTSQYIITSFVNIVNNITTIHQCKWDRLHLYACGTNVVIIMPNRAYWAETPSSLCQTRPSTSSSSSFINTTGQPHCSHIIVIIKTRRHRRQAIHTYQAVTLLQHCHCIQTTSSCITSHNTYTSINFHFIKILVSSP